MLDAVAQHRSGRGKAEMRRATVGGLAQGSHSALANALFGHLLAHLRKHFNGQSVHIHAVHTLKRWLMPAPALHNMGKNPGNSDAVGKWHLDVHSDRMGQKPA